MHFQLGEDPSKAFSVIVKFFSATLVSSSSSQCCSATNAIGNVIKTRYYYSIQCPSSAQISHSLPMAERVCNLSSIQPWQPPQCLQCNLVNPGERSLIGPHFLGLIHNITYNHKDIILYSWKYNLALFLFIPLKAYRNDIFVECTEIVCLNSWLFIISLKIIAPHNYLESGQFKLGDIVVVAADVSG